MTGVEFLRWLLDEVDSGRAKLTGLTMEPDGEAITSHARNGMPVVSYRVLGVDLKLEARLLRGPPHRIVPKI